MAKSNILGGDNLAHEILQSVSPDQVIETKILTDERVIARVTDGIYRQPVSALRELIANAYDADASRVVIKTDAPRFERFLIEDDGLGMSPEVLAHMLHHIGGSAKRQSIGKSLGVTDNSDSTLSPSGRKLIGKIGIGIFSVAQLTHNFQIITKTRGDKFRTIATIALKQYSDENYILDEKSNVDFESGKVNIWRERASDVEAHGTTIILTNIKPHARDTLRSREIWAAIDQSQNTAVTDEHQLIEPPKYHIGQVDPAGNTLKKVKGDAVNSLPWESSDTPETAFNKLVDSVWDELNYSNPNPKLEKLFDYYLQMIWQISLSIPLNYVDGHLFDMDLSGWAESFQIANEPKGAAKPLKLKPGKPIREILNLYDGTEKDQFDIYIDDLKLYRPIKFKNLPSSGHAIKTPLVFFGKCREEFKNYTYDLSGGPLEFEAYLFWNPKIAPAEHRGSLIRINGASGTLFDSSFLKYQVSEQTRLRQITCEVFINQGFDSALNIDRESFNYSHPHAVYLTRWLHSALRQLATAQKRVASDLRVVNRTEVKTHQLSQIQKIALDVWQEQAKDSDSTPPSIVIEDETAQPSLIPNADIAYNRSAIVSEKSRKNTPTSRTQNELQDEKIKAIAQVLASFGLLENLSKSKQERLLKAIYQILETTE